MNNPTTNSLPRDVQQHPSSDNKDILQDFIRRRDEIIKKMTRISQNINNENTKTMELRLLVFSKPQIQEAINIRNFLKNTNSDFFKFILKDLENDIQASFKCLKNLHDFCQAHQNLPHNEKVRQTSHLIESTWQQIYRLPIYDPILISEISKLEWTFRAIDVLSHNRDDSEYPYIQHCQTLKKGALESQNEGILTSRFYKIIEIELHKHKSLLDKTKLFFGQARNSNMQKMDIEEAKKLLQDLKGFGFEMKQKIEHVEGILAKASEIEEQYLKRDLASANDCKELMFQIKNFPIRFPIIEEHMDKLFNNPKGQFQEVLQETAQRIREGNKEVFSTFAREFEERVIKSETAGSDAEEMWINCQQEVQEIHRYSENLIENLHIFPFEELGRIRRQLTKRGYEHIQAELWLAQMRLLRVCCENQIKPSKPITFKELCYFESEIKDYVENHPKRAPFHEEIGFLRFFIQQIKGFIQEKRKKLRKCGEGIPNKIFSAFIDITKEVAKELFTRDPLNKKRNVIENKIKGVDSLEFSRRLESLNKKRSAIDNESKGINSLDKLGKKIKRICEIHHSLFSSSVKEK